MKGILLACLLVAFCATGVFAQIKIGNRSLDTKKMLGAASDVAKAVTLSDKDIAEMSRESVEWMDKNNKVSAPESEYSQRLGRITGKFGEVDGLKLNFKVYEVTDVNAFACGDGSIRVFSALMDMMTDDELAAVIGHEIGHVVHTDVKDAMKNAYLTSAALNAAGATDGVVAKLSDSEVGKLVEAFTGAKFSQKQEYEADDYAFDFCVKNGFDPYAMSNALKKLVELSNGEKASTVQKMFSSHPDSAKRAERMKEKADAHSRK
ncbi:MAG: peptidase M48 [Odoribacter splanchnicus]|nr:peptidase M48 [Odoribacter splanchnicus]